ncbi:hypothetical protein CERSUDRAFT_100886 [Gelatoporia subvermispora B]|uniref:MATH domain-containing protein n=1 Tax=Ceriporiopsis subvermispora (strain B) TaxID=914234 RepID=M2QFY8_CERS8|nr:hypothetical protein CERSUDRAFT_100886 [Gelatoporia subvermispora B]
MSAVSNDYSAVIRFKVHSLHDFFEPIKLEDTPCLASGVFTDDWKLEVKARELDGERCIGVFLRSLKTRQSHSVSWTISVQSLTGKDTWYTRDFEWPSGKRSWGTRRVLSKVRHWAKNAVLRAEDAVIIDLKLRSLMHPSNLKPSVAKTLYLSMVDNQHEYLRIQSYALRSCQGVVSNPSMSRVPAGLFEDYMINIADLDSDIERCEDDLGDWDEFTDCPLYEDSDFEDYVPDDHEMKSESADIDAMEMGEPIEDAAADNRSETIGKEGTFQGDQRPQEHVDTVATDGISISGSQSRNIPQEESAESDAMNGGEDVEDSWAVIGFATPTWSAFIYYLLTRTIAFAPLKSDGKEARDSYVKAYTVQLEELKTLAFRHLSSQATEQNILSELFSKFTSDHEDILKLELSVLTKHWAQLKDSDALRNKMTEVTSGAYPHAGKIVMEVFRKMSLNTD